MFLGRQSIYLVFDHRIRPNLQKKSNMFYKRESQERNRIERSSLTFDYVSCTKKT